ncbi:Zinc finger C2H2 type domain signature [Nakaseomyces glabratus]|nr:Zinc finger C2H2 type domain signature [Nakaseomyces glabratus]KAH7592482.1 Zinc finger C2H2 type domain signature [Nakaseomyces glabratus]KAH7610327.1 Zinc finger C2H2 type domain signature [Nakaseomyces glabratus]
MMTNGQDQHCLIPKKSRAVKTDKPRPFLCPICSRGFVRQEHLKRHQNSHTHEKPFLCLICGKCFARKDLVLRHLQKLHRDYKTEQLDKTIGRGKWDEKILNTPDVWNNDIVKVKGNKASILPTVDYTMHRQDLVLKSNDGNDSQTGISSQNSITFNNMSVSVGSSGVLEYESTSKRSTPGNHSSDSTPTDSSISRLRTEGSYTNTNNADGTLNPVPYHDLDLSSSSSLSFATPSYQNTRTSNNPVPIGGGTPLDVNWLNSVLESDNKINELASKSLSPSATLGQKSDKHNNIADFKLSLPESKKNRRYSYPNNLNDTTAKQSNDKNYTGSPLNPNGRMHSNGHNNPPSASNATVTLNTSAGIENHTINDKDLFRPDLNHNPSLSSLFKTEYPTSSEQPVIDIISQLSSEYTSPNDLSFVNLNQPNLGFFTQEWRDLILQKYSLLDNNFPTIKELNEYIEQYQKEFHPYFAFLHLHSVQPSLSRISLFLSVAAIGAFYSYNSTHSNLLANLAYGEINQLIKSVKLDSSPLWLVQTMLVLGFYAIFNNDISLVQSASDQFVMIVKIVKSAKINQPLETMVVPPTNLFPNPVTKTLTSDQIDAAYRYFITAQSRIHICHSMLFLSNIFPAMSGLEACFLSSDVLCGVPCPYEDLYTSKSPGEWYNNVLKNSIEIANSSQLVNLSNGMVSFQTCLEYLTTGNHVLYENIKLSLYTLLSLLVSIHEKILLERHKAKTEKDVQYNDTQWKLKQGPLIDSVIRKWEILYMKNGGILLPTENNVAKITGSHVMRNNVSFYLFAKLKRCIDLNHVIQKIWMRDWTTMNTALEEVIYDKESLQEATDYAISLLRSWASTFTILDDESMQAMKTPMFSMACIFSSILIIAEYLRSVERWAKTFNAGDPNAKTMNPTDKILWLKAGRLLKMFQKKLMSSDAKKYSEFAGVQKHEMLDITEVDESVLQRAIGLEAKVDETIQMILAASLASKALYIGVRVIGDTPIWPISVLFAQGLQSRAVYCVMKDEGVFT